MLWWAFVFLLLALISGALGFGGIASEALFIAKILFWIFLVFFIIGLIFGLRSRNR
ncbi:MAG: DUF1328 domain-containing protein [Verrucomicrobia bacterium]|nr:DUF1328 domain-containing protein [Verrucomicrobiota bacterium]